MPRDVEVVIAIPRLCERVRTVFELGEVATEVGSSDRRRSNAVGPPEVAGTVDSYGSQPGTEGAGALVVLEVGKSTNDDREDVLNEVLAVLRPDADPGQPAADARRVHIDEPAPGAPGGIAGAGEQAGRGGGHARVCKLNVGYCEFMRPVAGRPSRPRTRPSGRDGGKSIADDSAWPYQIIEPIYRRAGGPGDRPQ